MTSARSTNDAKTLTARAAARETSERIIAPKATGMIDVHAPRITLLAKVVSILVYLEEAASEGEHAFDWTAARSLLADREVQEWLQGMRNMALLPVKRSER